jgi:DNA modification methylase
MKRLINLLCRKTEVSIENKIAYRKEIKEIHKLLKQAYELQAESKAVIDYVKNVNYKDIYVMEHNKVLEQEKEITILRREVKKYEKNRPKMD